MSSQHLKEVCKIGQGNECCRYLTCGPQGFQCAKCSSLKYQLDARVMSSTMNARGDNCEGIVNVSV
jgi:hypothetical protein